MTQHTFGIIGCGNLGSAFLKSAIETENGPSKFYASVRSDASAEKLSKTFGKEVEVVRNNSELVKSCDVIVLGVKPFMLNDVCAQFNGLNMLDGKVVISLLAGKTIAQIYSALGTTEEKCAVFRATTNTPALVGEGMTALSYKGASEEQIDLVSRMFKQAGRCLILEEKHQDTCIGLCGSGPAFVFTIMEAMCDGAVRAGLPYDVARECAAQVLVGAGKLALTKQSAGDSAGSHPAVLKNAVTTPAGTTIGGLMVLEQHAVRYAVAKAVQEAAERSKALS